MMTKYLAGVLSVIAVGVLLIAYGLLNPRAAYGVPGEMGLAMRPVLMNDSLALRSFMDGGAGYVPAANAYGYVPYGQTVVMQAPEPRPVRTVSMAPAPPARQARRAQVYREPGRDWKRTAMIIGGSSAAGAGVGAIFGGKKGALIGAAIGGGASTIIESTR